jgi:hypothetical protein|tara:strand:+ start:6930 stop:7118 length:189 start_codon:yes stop_codon:yes gene_type:complete
MFTKIKDKKTGEITGFRTQQYEIGTYVIENDDASRQYSLDVDEKKFHNDLRRMDGFKVVESY